MVEKQLELKDTTARPEILAAHKAVCGTFWEPRLEETARFIDHTWQAQERSIIAVPCGGGKTLWSYAVILNHWRHTHKGNPPSPLYLVVDNLKTGSERLEYLLQLGVKRHHIGFYHSFWNLECQKLRGKDAYTFEQVSNSACKQCSENDKCHNYQRKTEIRKPVVIMAHEGFVRLQSTDLIPDDAAIIIDEEPDAYHLKEYTPAFFTSISSGLKQITGADPNASVEKFIKLVDDLSTLIANSTSSTGTMLFPDKRTQLISPEVRNEIIRIIETYADGSSSNSDPTEIDECSFDAFEPDLSIPQLREAVIDLSYTFAAGAKVFVAISIYRGKRLHVVRSRIDWNIGSKVILLNGSASLDRYEYPSSMNIWRCPEVEPSYPNLNLYCYRGLPTQAKLESKKHAQAFISYANEIVGWGSKVFLAVNKETLPELAKSLDSILITDDEGTGRLGSIIGRNDWLDYNHGILATSFFYPAHVYALYASLRTGTIYKASDLHRNRGYGSTLQHTGDRFINPEIQAEYIRHTSHGMYQIIMRLACRKNPEAEVHVVAMLPCFELLHPLSKVLRGFKVHGSSGWDFANTLLYSKEPISNQAVYKGFQLKDGGKNRLKVRKLMNLFGWTKKKNGHYWFPPEWGDHKEIVPPAITKKND